MLKLCDSPGGAGGQQSKHLLLARPRVAASDHRVGQNLCFAR